MKAIGSMADLQFISNITSFVFKPKVMSSAPWRQYLPTYIATVTYCTTALEVPDLETQSEKQTLYILFSWSDRNLS